MKILKRLFWFIMILPAIGIGGIILIPIKGMEYFSNYVDKLIEKLK